MPIKTETLKTCEGKILADEPLTSADGVYLFENAPLEWLGEQAQLVRERLHGAHIFFNRNIHFEPTNKCVYACKFCAFYRRPGSGAAQGAWDYSLKDLQALLEAHPAGTITEIHITGGVHPDRGLDYGLELLSYINTHRPELHIKAFTAVEVDYFSKKSGVTINVCLERLKAAGLGSLPGGGAEIFNTQVRGQIAGAKAPAHRWLDIHRHAHQLGISSNATMLYGHVETYAHRVEHLDILRQLQFETGGFNAFIPLRYRSANNKLGHLKEVAPGEDLRTMALSRLYLNNIPHLKAYWVMLGVDLAVKCLSYGADDIDGTIDDTTQIYSMAGGETKPGMSTIRLRDLITSQGLMPVERDSNYKPLD